MLDVDGRRLEMDVEAASLEDRRRAWRPPAPRAAGGVMGKYRRSVSSASDGAVTILAPAGSREDAP
mgnify:CR=1 FL=1